MSRMIAMALTGILLLGAAPSQGSPALLVQTVYAWSRSHNINNETAGLQPYLTPSLYDNLQKILRVDRCTNEANIDWDIFSGTQVATYGFRVGAAVVHGDSGTVPVTVSAGLTRSRAQSVSVKVIVTRGTGGWRIADILTPAPHGYASLRQQLDSDVAYFAKSSSRWTAAQRTCIGNAR